MLLPPGLSTLRVVFHFLVADMPALQHYPAQVLNTYVPEDWHFRQQRSNTKNQHTGMRINKCLIITAVNK